MLYKFKFNKEIKIMTKNQNKASNKMSNKTPSNNKGNSMGMKTLQTTASHANPDPSAT